MFASCRECLNFVNVVEIFLCIMHYHVRRALSFQTCQSLKEVCRDVSTEPKIQPLTGEIFEEKTVLIVHEAHCDVSARGFWFFCLTYMQT